MSKYFLTSELVTEGHPDKACDQISDAVPDAILAQDEKAHMACEVAATTGLTHVISETSTECYVDIPAIAREMIRGIGYDDSQHGFDSNSYDALTSIDMQPPDIVMGVSQSFEARGGATDENDLIGAGDQDIMPGLACNETTTLMPLSIHFVHALAKRLAAVREDGALPYLRPDGKTQVTVEYENGRPTRVEAVIVSTQHDPDVTQEQIHRDIFEQVIRPAVSADLLDENIRYYVSPTGRFVVGGPAGDSGLTGRKIIIGTYGGSGRHGGGAFSDKDPTKVDRPAAYAACYVAKNIVAAGLAEKCEVQLAYTIGVVRPVSIPVETFGTSTYTSAQLEAAIQKVFDLCPTVLIKSFGLNQSIYRLLAVYGHMGREDLGVAWEKTDKTEQLKAALA